MKWLAFGVGAIACGWVIRDMEDVLRVGPRDECCDICFEHMGYFPQGRVHQLCAFRAHLDQRVLPKNWIRW